MKQPVYDNLIFGQDKLKFIETVKAEVKTDIKAQDVKKVLGVFALPLATENEVKAETLKVSGKIVFYLTFVDTAGQIRKRECGSEILAVFGDKNILEGDFASSFASVIKSGYDDRGENISLFAEVKVLATVKGDTGVSVIVGGDDVITDKCEIVYEKRFGVNKGAYPIDEEFELSYTVEEVLSQKAVAVVSAVQCGVSSVIVDGEIYFSALLLQKSEKGDIIREDKVIPFRMETECEEAMPSMRAITSLIVKSFKTDIEVNAEENKSLVRLSTTLSYCNEVFADAEAETVVDAFSTCAELEVLSDEVRYDSIGDVRLIKKKVSARAQTEELPIGARLTAVGGENVEILSSSCENGRVKVEGIISLTACYQDVNEGAFSFNLEVPFETSLDVVLPCNNADVYAVISYANAKTHSVSQTEVSAELVFSVYPREQKTVKYVKEIKCVGDRPMQTGALSVYIPLEGEKLWSLAKRLGVCPDEVLRTNPDLQFPLSGKERIVIYRKLS